MSVTGSPSNKETGLTLLELLVVVGLIAAFSVLAVGTLDPARNKFVLRRLTQKIVFELERARSEALRKGHSTAFFFDVAGRRFGMKGGLLSHPLPSQVTAELVAAKDISKASHIAEIRFYPGGNATGGTLTLKDGGGQSVIEIDWLTGRILHAN